MKNYNLNISNVLGHVNQFEVYVDGVYYFYSYNSLCCVIDSDDRIIFGRDWDYSKTTSKHLCAFLNDHYIRLNNKKDVEKAIKDWQYNEYKIIYNEALH